MTDAGNPPPGPVSLEGRWEGPRRVATGRPVLGLDDDAHGVAIPLRRSPWYAVPLLAVVGLGLVGAFVAGLLALLGGRAASPWAWLTLVPLAVFGALGLFLLAAIGPTLRAMAPGRRWLLTPDALVTTSLTIDWADIAGVRRSTIHYPSRLGSPRQHVLSVELSPHAHVPEVEQRRFASALLSSAAGRGLALGDIATLGVDPDALAAAIALLAARPDLRPLLTQPAGVRLVDRPATGEQ